MHAIEEQPAGHVDSADRMPRIHAAGTTALLLDAAAGEFDQAIQERIWALSALLSGGKVLDGVRETVPGVNNLLVVFDPVLLQPASARARLVGLWETLEVKARPGRDIEVPVLYGADAGEDLPALAAGAGLTIEAFVGLHSAAVYSVACIGAYPGFAFLTGLPARLATPRRQVPRTKVAKGSVAIGGSHAGVMPCTAPSGWHLVGMTTLDTFDPHRSVPCLLAPGDRVHFRVEGIAS
ncbi:allophanate hydrolase [Cupriavidus sp. TA19]|uniref:5-oxoprolinase subunit PxpB n=1 Tax=unclassified Cupriavidus TaxID=2640874 RepID=UPI000EC4EC0F|nr:MULTISPECIES: 5-oxoprolinase subunit PxpB [unclassified Cupriavidus]BDB24080.1 5-oxoprolinase subunit PxpB [Cupriavidus sp. P-10]GLC92783.1 allophanate hydrolase [Cupriavidus sp. TA19]